MSADSATANWVDDGEATAQNVRVGKKQNVCLNKELTPTIR